MRSLPGGAATAGLPPALIGLEDRPDAPPPGDLCAALFGAATAGVPVAFFTDHYCPNCRSMAAKLEGQADVAITRHELPVLGRDSVMAARAALAAGLQDGRAAFHARMRRAAFAPTEAYLRDIAKGLGLDPDRLVADLDRPEVDAALERELRLAAALGFAAVPVAVVGRTVVVGDVPERRLDRVFEAERRAGPACPLRE